MFDAIGSSPSFSHEIVNFEDLKESGADEEIDPESNPDEYSQSAAVSVLVQDRPEVRGHAASWLEIVNDGSIWVLLAMLSGAIGNTAYDQGQRILEEIRRRRRGDPCLLEDEAKILAQHAVRAYLGTGMKLIILLTGDR